MFGAATDVYGMHTPAFGPTCARAHDETFPVYPPSCPVSMPRTRAFGGWRRVVDRRARPSRCLCLKPSLGAGVLLCTLL